MHLLFLLLLALAQFVAEAKLNIVTTTADLGAIAREIGGDHVKVTVLARPTEDPHFIDPKPSFLVQLSRADLLIEGGVDLESGWLRPLVDRARNPKLIEGAPGRLKASQGIELMEIPVELDRAKGDIHAFGNPHFLVDPVNAKTVTKSITEKLCALDPSSCQHYRKNQEAFYAKLEEKLAEWSQLLKPFAGQRIVAYHNSWPYFGRRFGLKIDLFLEPKPGIPPSPSHLSEVIAQMKRDKVKAIFCDPYLNHRIAERVAEETGATIVETSHFPGGLKEVDDRYIPLIDHIVRTLAAALKG